MKFTFIDQEKLCLYQDGKVEKYESTFLTHYRETSLRDVKNKEWKQSSDAMLYDLPFERNSRVVARLCSLLPTNEENKLVYAFTVNQTSGIYYKYIDDEKKTEAHYLTSNEDAFLDLTVCDNGEMAGAVQRTPLSSDIAIFAKDGGEYKTVTGGDSKDENPFLGENGVIYFNSYGIGRDMNNEFVRYAPSEILKLNTRTMEIETLLSDPKYSYIKPMLDKEGNLICIQKPAEDKESGNSLLNILLAPVRIIEAIVGFVSMFVKVFTGKPLVDGKGKTRSGGAAARMPDEESFLLHNYKLNVEEELKRNEKEEDGGFIPRSWRLVIFPKNQGDFEKGAYQVCVELAKGVADYTLIQEDGEVKFLYTNGKRIFLLKPNGEKKKLCNTDFCVHIGAVQTASEETDLFGNL